MYDQVLKFWFHDIASTQWWKKDPVFDQHIAEKFSDMHAQAAQCELYTWRSHPKGRLAEIIILDQFSRNIFRGSPKAFGQDALALALAQEAVVAGVDKALSETECSFLYMPYMHSESRKIHENAVMLYEKLGNKENLDFEIKHKDIIDHFGRYPHRNMILGRESTKEEIEFLSRPNSGF